MLNGKWMSQTITGTQRYAQEVTRQIVAQLGKETTIAVPRDAVVPDWASDATVITSRFRGMLFEQLALPLIARSYRLINFAGPAPILARNEVVVLFDALCFRYPNSYRRLFSMWYRFMARTFVRTSRRVATISEFSQQELSEVLSVPADRIRVALCGADHFDTPASTTAPLGMNDVDGAFVVIVGTPANHKNMLRPALALAEAGVTVALVGASGARHVFDSATEITGGGRTIVLGRISDGELAWLFENAAALVFPSLYEGFGLPIVEAQFRGCPVISSNAASMPEVAGPGALYFDPEDTAELVARTRELLASDSLREKVIANGLANAGRFRWSDTARTIVDLARERA